MIDAHVEDFGFAAGRDGDHVLYRMVRIAERHLDAPIREGHDIRLRVVPEAVFFPLNASGNLLDLAVFFDEKAVIFAAFPAFMRPEIARLVRMRFSLLHAMNRADAAFVARFGDMPDLQGFFEAKFAARMRMDRVSVAIKLMIMIRDACGRNMIGKIR